MCISCLSLRGTFVEVFVFRDCGQPICLMLPCVSMFSSSWSSTTVAVSHKIVVETFDSIVFFFSFDMCEVLTLRMVYAETLGTCLSGRFASMWTCSTKVRFCGSDPSFSSAAFAAFLIQLSVNYVGLPYANIHKYLHAIGPCNLRVSFLNVIFIGCSKLSRKRRKVENNTHTRVT